MSKNMLNVKLIGAGAAGNKAVITAVESGVISKEDIFLLNSTEKDIPKEYIESLPSEQIYMLSSELGGCGKEPKMARKLALSALQNELLGDALEEFILVEEGQEDTDVVIITGSTEGGTGCGSVPIVANYIEKVLGVPVVVEALDGFGKDARGLQNTIFFYKSLAENEHLAIQSICNSKFLVDCNGDELAAEKLANDEFVTRVSIIAGANVYSSDQNMDKTDYFKVVTREGYTDILHIDIEEKIKNKAQFESYLKELVDSSKSLETESKQQVMGIIINIPENQKQYIDFDFKEIIGTYGKPYERHIHIQNVEGYATSISAILAGMLIPQNELVAIYNAYIEESEQVQKMSKSAAFKIFDEMDDADGADEFNMGRRRKKKGTNKGDFFSQFNSNETNKPKVLTKVPGTSKL